MSRRLTPLLVVLALSPLVLRVAASQERGAGSPEAPVVLLLLRHAEAEPGGGDPPLADAGEARARALARLLGAAGVDRLVASPLRRTRETLAPLADAAGLEVEVRPPLDVAALAAELGDVEPGSLVVVCGHSNTIPPLARELGADLGLDHLPDDEHDRIVGIALASGAPPTAFELRYGAP